MDKNALYLLFQVVDELDFEKIVGTSTSKKGWDTLQKVVKRPDWVKEVWIQTLQGELEVMKVEELEDVSSYVTREQTMVNQLKHNGKTLTYTRFVEKILQSLTNDFENILHVIEESKNLEEIASRNLESSLELHEQWKNKEKQEVLE